MMEENQDFNLEPENHKNEEQEQEEPAHKDSFELNPTMPPAQAAVFALIAVFLIYQIGAGTITLLIFGFDLENANPNALRIMTAVGQILLILGPALLFSRLIYNDISRVMRFRLPNRRQIAIFIFGLIILIPLLQSYMYIQNYIFQQLAESSSFFHKIKELTDFFDKLIEESYLILLRHESFIDGIIIVFVVTVVPSLSEELFFRGFIQKSFELRYRPVTAVAITGAVFAAYHFNPYQLIPLFMIGFYLGYSVYVTDSIVTGVLLHFINNLTAVLAFFIFGEEDFVNTALSGESLPTHLISFTLLLVVFASVIYFINKHSNTILK
jgi:membrane protease YdiL (CAAX protease family)